MLVDKLDLAESGHHDLNATNMGLGFQQTISPMNISDGLNEGCRVCTALPGQRSIKDELNAASLVSSTTCCINPRLGAQGIPRHGVTCWILHTH